MMPRKILIIGSSSDKNVMLVQAFKRLAEKNFSFSLWSPSRALLEQFKRQSWPTRKIFLGPDLKNNFNTLLFLVSLPFFQFKTFFALSGLRLKGATDLIVCLNLKEKIMATALARLLSLKVVWLENPNLNYGQNNKFLLWFYKINSRLAEIIVFNDFSKSRLINLNCRADKIKLANPGAQFNRYQENIFDKLAAAGKNNFHRKYFTIGAVTALDQKQKIETIFQAVKICLAMIPNLQLIIIGAGPERKNLLWLAKRMGIENLVWLVGEQEQLKKWLDSFDIFWVAGDNLKLDDYGNIIEAMAAGLPVLAPRNIGLEDLVAENKTGSLLEAGNNEMLARQIIKLHQDKRLRLFLSKNSRERAEELFTLDKMAERLEELLK